ncbi:hypothetical protein TSUD_121730 [Trifolium subterraneum]|nr:hypothetical protein TSUD_121730 [Trifolium subterraneum]
MDIFVAVKVRWEGYRQTTNDAITAHPNERILFELYGGKLVLDRALRAISTEIHNKNFEHGRNDEFDLDKSITTTV